MTIGPLVQSWGHNEKNGTAEKKCLHFCQSGLTLSEIYFSSPEPQARSPGELKVYPCSGVGPSTVFKHFRIFIIISAVAVGSSLARENMRDKPTSACGPFSLGITRLPSSTQ